MGKATGAAREDMSVVISAIVPLWVDAGYRIDPNVFVGAYFQYGFGINNGDFQDACD